MMQLSRSRQIYQLLYQYAIRGRPNSLKIVNRRRHTTRGLIKYLFSMRITNVWNSLPLSVITAPSVNSFNKKPSCRWNSRPWCLTAPLGVT